MGFGRKIASEGFELGGKIERALLLLFRVFLNQRLFDLMQMLLIYGLFCFSFKVGGQQHLDFFLSLSLLQPKLISFLI